MTDDLTPRIRDYMLRADTLLGYIAQFVHDQQLRDRAHVLLQVGAEFRSQMARDELSMPNVDKATRRHADALAILLKLIDVTPANMRSPESLTHSAVSLADKLADMLATI